MLQVAEKQLWKNSFLVTFYICHYVSNGHKDFPDIFRTFLSSKLQATYEVHKWVSYLLQPTASYISSQKNQMKQK